MRILLVDHYYSTFLQTFYAGRPELARATYAEQYSALRDERFGEAAFEAAALRALGHEVEHHILNAFPLQRAWADEHDRRLKRARRFGLRRGVVPWYSASFDDSWMWDALVAQAEDFAPDVVYITSVDLVPREVVAGLAARTRLVVGQIAADLPLGNYRAYGLLVSSIPDLVARFRSDGIQSEYLPLAFEPSLVDEFPAARDIPVSFVGSLSSRYDDRAQVIAEVAKATPLQIWTADADRVPKPAKQRIQGAAFGRAMYHVLARSLITINTHGRVAGRAANNLRLYEATGMGALLLTDARDNLGELFEVGREVAAFRDEHEAGELARYFLLNRAEASTIAKRGQDRTLRDHTWAKRMGQLERMVSDRI